MPQYLTSLVFTVLAGFYCVRNVLSFVINSLGSLDAIASDVSFGAQAPQGGSADSEHVEYVLFRNELEVCFV